MQTINDSDHLADMFTVGMGEIIADYMESMEAADTAYMKECKKISTNRKYDEASHVNKYYIRKLNLHYRYKRKLDAAQAMQNAISRLLKDQSEKANSDINRSCADVYRAKIDALKEDMLIAVDNLVKKHNFKKTDVDITGVPLYFSTMAKTYIQWVGNERVEITLSAKMVKE